MGLGRELESELHRPPAFAPGARVRAEKLVRNDGTFAGREIGEVLARKGEEGYVRDIGTYLQRHYVYAVEFIASGHVVGMLARELISAGEERTSEEEGRP
ncbi:nitrogen fixation protein NifZ [Afifella pfennigii]|uniref:nitrogen fixation protein NifZ n=1 Tax=Afifella pfennigii TaxID=209897 RepID=UPI00047B2ED3|nr:nitrogen fixation protein NifZ [Afifella pfennigii]